MPAYTASEKATIIKLADSGCSWEQIGNELDRTALAVECAARRMRQAGEWPENPRSVRVAPAGPGRPRNRVQTTSVSVRVSPAMAYALRDISEEAGFGRRIGKVFDVAVARALATASRRELPPLPIDPYARPQELENSPKTNTISVCVASEPFAALLHKQPKLVPMAVAALAIEQLLRDVGFVFVEQ